VKIVLDTSVLIAAHISRAGVCSQLFEEIVVGHDLVLSEFILAEFERKLSVKFKFPASDVTSAADFLRRTAIFVPQLIPVDVCRDVDDLPILGTAVAVGADLIVTVDQDLLTLGSYRDVPIIKPDQYWHRVGG
jgi:putative PIN family toxin of toxin-antitoxin system